MAPEKILLVCFSPECGTCLFGVPRVIAPLLAAHNPLSAGRAAIKVRPWTAAKSGNTSRCGGESLSSQVAVYLRSPRKCRLPHL